MKKLLIFLLLSVTILGGCFSSSGGGGDDGNQKIETSTVDLSGKGKIYFEIMNLKNSYTIGDKVKLKLKIDNPDYLINNAEIKIEYNVNGLEIKEKSENIVEYDNLYNIPLQNEDNIILNNGKFILLYSSDSDIKAPFNGELGILEFIVKDTENVMVEITNVVMTAIEDREVVSYINLNRENIEIK